MHPELIKAHLRIGGTTPAALADELRVSKGTVSQVIAGKSVSRRIAERISQLTGRSLAELWPDQYGAKQRPNPLRRDQMRRAA
ncbi:MAG: helix-turn-helix domain-containing protein [Rubrivivax sp.]|nr:helix-turn-helix domain-containing protein [Rubrivivax sp.]